MKHAKEHLTSLKKILVDASNKGTFLNTAIQELEVEAEVSSPPASHKGIVPLAKRWISERTFG